MPYKPRRGCQYPGCNKLVADASSRAYKEWAEDSIAKNYNIEKENNKPGGANLKSLGASFLEKNKNHWGAVFIRAPLFCEEHLHLQQRNYDRFKRKYKHRERYDSRWDKVRNIYIKEHPLCEECLKNEIITNARIVHHKVPIEDGGAIYDYENLMSVCDSCHQKIHDRINKNKN